MSNILEEAKKYLTQGLCVLPVNEDKRPAIAWKELQSRLTNEYELAQCESSYGIGIVCGKISGNLECIDIDTKHDPTGQLYESFITKIRTRNPVLFGRLRIINTRSGGSHIIYKCQEIGGAKKLANSTTNESLIETRGEGNYIVAPPTKGYHPIKDREIPTITPEERQLLFTIAKEFDQTPFKQTYTPTPKQTLVEEGSSPWGDYNVNGIDHMLSTLEKHGWKFVRKDGQRLRYKRPGNTDSAHSGDYSYERNLFTVFTTSTQFEPLRGYSPFGVYTELECNGDFKKAALQLSELGYGKKKEMELTEVTADNTPVSKESSLDEILSTVLVDASAELTEPPVCFEFTNRNGFTPVGTLSNFSALIGKAKSKKSFFVNLLLSTAIDPNRTDKIKCTRSDGEIILFDTEQSPFHVQRNVHRILNGIPKPDFFNTYCLRKFDPKERINLIRHRVYQMPQGSIVIIDGIRDLAFDINSSEEATKITTELMKWSEERMIHIIVVIHQNKADNNARGHLGTEIVNKAETVISIEKDKDRPEVSIVQAEFCRDREFEPFALSINENGITEIIEDGVIITDSQKKSKVKIAPHNLPKETHIKIIREALSHQQEFKYSEVLAHITLSLGTYSVTVGRNKAIEFMEYYKKNGWIVEKGLSGNKRYTTCLDG